MNRLLIIKNQLSQSLKVELERDDQVGILYMNSPKEMNALTPQMRQELVTKLVELDQDDSIKVIVILSKVEKAFCAGFNIKDFVDRDYKDEIKNPVCQSISDTLNSIKKPIVVGINGLALGGGFEIALTSDVIVAADNAKLGLPEMNLGLTPGIGGTQRLTAVAGRINASRYIFTGDFMTAQDAMQMGVVTKVVRKEDLHQETIGMAKKMAQKSLYGLMITKNLIRQAEQKGINLEYERLAFGSLFALSAAKEGVTAFVNKKKVDLKNH